MVQGLHLSRTEARRAMPGTMSIHQFLSEAHVPYVVLPHRAAFTAQEEAAATHVRGRD